MCVCTHNFLRALLTSSIKTLIVYATTTTAIINNARAAPESESIAHNNIII